MATEKNKNTRTHVALNKKSSKTYELVNRAHHVPPTAEVTAAAAAAIIAARRKKKKHTTGARKEEVQKKNKKNNYNNYNNYNNLNMSSTDQDSISGIVVLLIVFLSVGAAIMALIVVVKWLTRREKRQLESSGLVKTTPVENRDYKAEFQLLSTSGSSFNLNDNGDLDFQSESRRVNLNASGHEDQMTHEQSVHNRVSERIGVGTAHRVFTNDNMTRKIVAHTEGGGFSNPSEFNS